MQILDKSSISSLRYCIFENRVARAPVKYIVWKTQHLRCQMATFVNLSNTSLLICIIAKSLHKYEKHKQKGLFGVDCCCAAIVVVLRRLENIIFENALPPREFARCYLNSQYLRGENGQHNYKTCSKTLPPFGRATRELQKRSLAGRCPRGETISKDSILHNPIATYSI